jgi:hypothetical protein
VPTHHNGGFAEPHTTVARLKDEVEQAKALYQSAKAALDGAIDRMHNFGAAHPDGSATHATKGYNYTLQTYRRAVYRLNRYLLDGSFPDGRQLPGRTIRAEGGGLT